jgi:hypothetical protein
MIDGIKSFNVATFAEIIQNHSDCIKGNTITRNGVTIYEYKCDSLKFTVQGNNVSLHGSIHKYFNDGQNNNEFVRGQLIEALNDLWVRFRINPYCTIINSLEIGVNLNYEPKKFINAIVEYKDKPVQITKNDFLYSESEHNKKSRYYMKAYDKDGMLRIEVHFCRMADLNKKGIKTLADLTTPENYKLLGEMLFNYYENYLVFDNTLCIGKTKPLEREILLNGQNPRYWNIERSNNTENYKYYRNRFNELSRKYEQDSIKKEVRKLIGSKINQLNVTDKSFPELTKCLELNQTFSNQKFPRINTIDECTEKGNIILQQTTRTCIITGLDISMQKDCSKFICTTGIKWYYDNSPQVFYSLLHKRIARSKYKNASIEKQIEEIHHSIRNEYNNVYHNFNRDSKKRGAKLFDDEPYLCERLKSIIIYKKSI